LAILSRESQKAHRNPRSGRHSCETPSPVSHIGRWKCRDSLWCHGCVPPCGTHPCLLSIALPSILPVNEVHATRVPLNLSRHGWAAHIRGTKQQPRPIESVALSGRKRRIRRRIKACLAKFSTWPPTGPIH